MNPVRSADIFCKVIDNFGDAGVCWRLARSMAQAGLSVRLWIDDLHRLQRLRPALDPAIPSQSLDGFTVIRWDDACAIPPTCKPADLLVEAFACRMPETMLGVLAQAEPRRAWINLDYLTAEGWARDSHTLPSPHPRLPLTQYFYFPGFQPGSGGLMREAGLDDARAGFDARARAGFLADLGAPLSGGEDDGLLVSMFCYPQAPLDALLLAMQSGPRVNCLVPEGVGGEAIARMLGAHPQPGTRVTRGNLTLTVIPFLEPDDYDRLLWSCDLNFVRGEDSLVRAHWAERPFVWQLYPQAERAQQPKLDAFLDVFLPDLGQASATAVGSFWQWWNADAPQADTPDWPALCTALPDWVVHTRQWTLKVRAAGELSRSIVEFAGKIR